MAAASKDSASEGNACMDKLQKSTRLPDKIMRILLSNEATDAIWWLPKGESFAIQKDKFEGEILMKYFRGNKFKSLVRNLHRWGFRRTTFEGDASGKTVAFSHPYFRKDKPELVLKVEMTTEIKGKKQDQKSTLGKRQAAHLLRDESGPLSKQNSLQTPPSPSMAESSGQPQKTTGLGPASQQRSPQPPTMQSFALNAASLRTDHGSLLASGNSRGVSLANPYSSLADAATLQGVRATRDFRFGYGGASLEASQQLRDQLHGEQSFLSLLRAPTSLLLQRQMSNSMQGGVLPRTHTYLNSTSPSSSSFSSLFHSTASSESIRHPQAAMQELLRRQQLHESLLHRPLASSANSHFQITDDARQPHDQGASKQNQDR